jgi:hypothetical protein
MVLRKPIVYISGVANELPPGDTVEGATTTTSIAAGSGLSGGGSLSSNVQIDVNIAAAPSGLIFVGDSLGIDGTALAAANAAQASGNAALVSAAARLPLTGGTLSGPLTASGFLSASGTVFDTAGNVRNIPANPQSSLYLVQSSDNGKYVSVASGTVRVPSGVFTAGQVFSIYNDSAGTQTISGSAGTTLRQAGTTNTGVRSVAAYGICTALCVGSETFVITGAGLT